MNRRDFVLGAIGLPRVASASAQTRVPTIAIVLLREPSASEGFSMSRTAVATLKSLGWETGRTALVEVTSAGGRLSDLPSIAEQVVKRNPDVIMAAGGSVTAAVAAATREIPIVMSASAFDPVERGWAETYSRPGRNVTGLTFGADEVVDKQLELLTKVAPGVRHVGLLRTRANAANRSIIDRAEQTAPKLGLRTTLGELGAETEIEAVLTQMRSAGADALLPIVDPIMDGMRARLAEAALRLRLATAAQLPFYATAGFLVTYAADLTDLHRRACTYVDQILKGRKAAELPIERPTKFTFTLNLKTARALGLAISPLVLAEADEVIE